MAILGLALPLWLFLYLPHTLCFTWTNVEFIKHHIRNALSLQECDMQKCMQKTFSCSWMHVCWCTGTCVHVCRDSSWYQVSSLLTLHIIYWCRVFCWTQNSGVQLACLLQGILIHPPIAEIKAATTPPSFSVSCVDLNSSPPTCSACSLSFEPCP